MPTRSHWVLILISILIYYLNSEELYSTLNWNVHNYKNSDHTMERKNEHSLEIVRAELKEKRGYPTLLLGKLSLSQSASTKDIKTVSLCTNHQTLIVSG